MIRDQMRLGRRSLAALIDRVNQYYTDAEIKQLVFRHGLNARYIGQNKLYRLGAVFHPLVEEEADETEVQNAIGLFEEVGQNFDDARYDPAILTGFQEALRADGTRFGRRVESFPFSPLQLLPKESKVCWSPDCLVMVSR